MKYVQVQTLIQTALEIATARKQNIAVAVVDTHGELLGFARMDDVLSLIHI